MEANRGMRGPPGSRGGGHTDMEGRGGYTSGRFGGRGGTKGERGPRGGRGDDCDLLLLPQRARSYEVSEPPSERETSERCTYFCHSS